MIAGTWADDVLDPSKKSVTEQGLRTDGVWVWPCELAYYVATYGCELPAEFVEHMRAVNWRPPSFTHEELRPFCEEQIRLIYGGSPQPQVDRELENAEGTAAELKRAEKKAP